MSVKGVRRPELMLRSSSGGGLATVFCWMAMLEVHGLDLQELLVTRQCIRLDQVYVFTVAVGGLTVRGTFLQPATRHYTTVGPGKPGTPLVVRRASARAVGWPCQTELPNTVASLPAATGGVCDKPRCRSLAAHSPFVSRHRLQSPSNASPPLLSFACAPAGCRQKCYQLLR
jgi:hypothetical protein